MKISVADITLPEMTSSRRGDCSRPPISTRHALAIFAVLSKLPIAENRVKLDVQMDFSRVAAHSDAMEVGNASELLEMRLELPNR